MVPDTLDTCYDCAAILGLDPTRRGLTLRRLWQMVETKREYEGGLFAWLASTIVRHLPLTAQNLNPNTINPWRRGSSEIEKKLAEVRRFVANCYLAELAKRAARKARKGT